MNSSSKKTFFVESPNSTLPKIQKKSFKSFHSLRRNKKEIEYDPLSDLLKKKIASPQSTNYFWKNQSKNSTSFKTGFPANQKTRSKLIMNFRSDSEKNFREPSVDIDPIGLVYQMDHWLTRKKNSNNIIFYKQRSDVAKKKRTNSF